MRDIDRPGDGYRLIILPWVGSTNTLLGRLAAHGATAGTVLIAREQRVGRGRRGRHWISPPGNLYMSALLKPDLPAARGGQIGFVAGLAVAETLAQRIDGPTIALKWPNDVLVDGRKIAGLLPEAAIEGDRLAHIVLGIGVNLATAPAADVRRSAVALAAYGAAPRDPVDFTVDLIGRLAHWMNVWARDGFEPVRTTWLRRAWGLGEDFRSEAGDAAVSGRFDGIDDDGALVLALPGGGRKLVRSGEVFPAGTG